MNNEPKQVSDCHHAKTELYSSDFQGSVLICMACHKNCTPLVQDDTSKPEPTKESVAKYIYKHFGKAIERLGDEPTPKAQKGVSICCKSDYGRVEGAVHCFKCGNVLTPSGLNVFVPPEPSERNICRAKNCQMDGFFKTESGHGHCAYCRKKELPLCHCIRTPEPSVSEWEKQFREVVLNFVEHQPRAEFVRGYDFSEFKELIESIERKAEERGKREMKAYNDTVANLLVIARREARAEERKRILKMVKTMVHNSTYDSHVREIDIQALIDRLAKEPNT